MHSTEFGKEAPITEALAAFAGNPEFVQHDIDEFQNFLFIGFTKKPAYVGTHNSIGAQPEEVQRVYAKIVFNVLARVKGQDFVLRQEFNEIRTAILTGAEIHKLVSYRQLDFAKEINEIFELSGYELLSPVFTFATGNKKRMVVSRIKLARIQNRRFLGNKFKLLSFIRQTVEENCPNVEVVTDIFVGTGADLIRYYNQQNIAEENYMTENFADTYFSRNDCAKIGFIRDDIERQYRLNLIKDRERAVLIASLIYAMDSIAETCGHYDAFRQNAIFDRHLILPALDVPVSNNANNRCFNEDANSLVRHIRAELVYLDPPYNSRQYSDTYHLLENVARWEKPPVYGVARKMNRAGLKSAYCTRKAAEVFEDLIQNIDANFILLSYNNMANSGNARSNARISDADILRILSAKGSVKIFSKAYRAFSAGKSAKRLNEERLFLCKVCCL